ncbi:N-formylglutamate amidohydrolase [Sagittula sp. NFXS13]|uniref:N-formylglutamate amidohydrolase n=1 Tax=Sagittula sp. NFXS13 TaxID=2819095 RepID=UPI0032DF4E88
MTYQPYTVMGAERDSRFLITCDHATNVVPPELGGSLGLPEADMLRHIAFDPGAEGVARALADTLGAPAILSNFSRLVIDPNRGEDDPTVLMRLYDGSVIPGNRPSDGAEKARRLNAYHRPYHDALEQLATRRNDTVLVSVHSFTPQLRGRRPRPWHVGILHAWDARLSDPLIAALERERDIVVGRNEPYPGHLPGDSMDRHALKHGRPNTLIELRQDIIATPEQQQAWGDRLAPLLVEALTNVTD